MADAIQLASAVFSLAEVAYHAVRLVRKLYHAQKGARELCRKVERLSVVIDNMQHFADSERSAHNDRPVSAHENSIRQSALQSIVECEISVRALNKKLSPLLQDDRTIEVLVRLKYVFMERAIKRHESNIEAQFQSLTLSLLALNGLNSNVNHDITHESQQTIINILHNFVYLVLSQRPSTVGVVARGRADATNSTEHTSSNIPLAIEESTEHTPDVRELLAESLGASRQPLQSITARQIDDNSVQEIFSDADETQVNVDSPLAAAVKGNKASIVSYLIEEDADITERDTEGWTLLHHAAFERAAGSLQILLNTDTGRSPDFVNAQNHYGQTALMLAAQQAYSSTCFKIAEKLITNHCDINLADKDNSTALYIVIAQTWDVNRDKFARLLLDKGADPEVVRPLQNSKRYPATREVLYGAQRRDSVVSNTG